MNKKITILELHSDLHYAGGSRNMITFSKYLDKRFFDVTVGGYRGGGVMESVLCSLDIPYIVGDGTSKKIVTEFEVFDVVHIHRSGHHVSLESEIIQKIKENNPRIIVIENNIFGKFDNKSEVLFDCHMFQSMMHVHERYLKSSGLSFDFETMKVLYNMVDSAELEKFRATKNEISVYRNSLGIKDSDFVIGKIARAHIAKWSDLILDMMPYLIELIPNIKFIIIGVPESRKIRILNSKLKDYIIIQNPTANQKNIHLFYQSIDVLAHSSKIGECNGNTINEAMYWRKPVVVNSTPHKDNGQLEQVDHMKNGMVANFPQTYARAIHYLFRNPDEQRRMGENGYHKIITLNNPENIVRQFEKICFEQLRERGFALAQSVIDFYAKISYNPSENDIVAYAEEYHRRVTQEFGKLSFVEKVNNICKVPKKWYWKIKDFLEDKFGW